MLNDSSLLRRLTDRSIYTSEPFKFIVDGKIFYIHAELISKVSKPLDRMINGQMSEALKGEAVLQDVDPGTFARFSDWAYKGWYTAANFMVVESEHSSAKSSAENLREMLEQTEPHEHRPETSSLEAIEDPDEPEPNPPASEANDEEQQHIDAVLQASQGMVKAVDPTNGQRFCRRRDIYLTFVKRKVFLRTEVADIPPTRVNQNESEDYTEVFLSHARLYVFAEKYDIQPLKVLALECLQDQLGVFELYEERTGDIIALLHYVYAETGESVPAFEDLRTLMRHYVGYEMVTLMKDGDFQTAMFRDRTGGLLADFVSMVAKRVNDE